MDDLDYPVKVAEVPGCEAKTCDAEERVEDLAVDFEPDFAWRVVVGGEWVVHCRCGFEEEEEEHSSHAFDVFVHICCVGLGSSVRIYHDVQEVDSDQET